MGRVLKLMIVGLGALSGVLAAGFIVFAGTVFTYDPKAAADGDAVVVLTGGELRVREGLRLFGAGTGRRLLISGVNQATTRRDLSHLTEVAPILFNCCVDVDYRARNTLSNAAETRGWLQAWGFHRLVVVTSNYHMPRSLMALSRALPGVELIPHAVVSPRYRLAEWWRHPGAVKLVVVEYLKFLPAAVRLVASRIGAPIPQALPLPPAPEVTSAGPNVTGL